MDKNKPFIGLTPAFDKEKGSTQLDTRYHDSVIMAGGVPLLLPMTDDLTVLEALILKCDGLILTGGPDIDPEAYGETNKNCDIVSGERDRLEFFVFEKALERQIPIFGICRGIQVINVAMGGTLYQDIDKEIHRVKPLFHRQREPADQTSHHLDIIPETFVYEVFGSTKGRVNSFHHQSVKDVAPGFKVTSYSPDNIIESIEYTKNGFVVGVQWHPERMWARDMGSLKIFKMFIEKVN